MNKNEAISGNGYIILLTSSAGSVPEFFGSGFNFEKEFGSGFDRFQ